MAELEPGNDIDHPNRSSLTPEDRRRVTRASMLKPLNLIVLLVGAGAFAATGSFWFVPLTLVTYLVLVLLAARDPFFMRRVLEGRGIQAPRGEAREISPERRARWLPRGETRQRVESALEMYRKVVAAIEESDDVTRAVLDDAVPKLHAVANRLVDIAHNREKAAQIIAEARGSDIPEKQDTATIRELEGEIQSADAEISASFEKLVDLHTRVVRVSLGSSSPSRPAVTELNESLDQLNLRLEALDETMSPPSPPQREP